MIEAGEQVYDEHCASCHGDKLRSTGAMPDLKELRADDRPKFDKFVMEGRGQMPPWQGTLSKQGRVRSAVGLHSLPRHWQMMPSFEIRSGAIDCKKKPRGKCPGAMFARPSEVIATRA